MLILLLFSLLTIDVVYGIQCITNCTVGRFHFDQAFRIPDGQCRHRISKDSCSVEIKLRYDDQTYSVDFDWGFVSSDYIYITSGNSLYYRITYSCTKETNCVLSYLHNRIGEITSRSYNAKHIYNQIALLIENPSRNGSIQCYNNKNEIIICSSNEICHLEYDQIENKVKSRGCDANNGARLRIYDGRSYTSFFVECARNLCNDDATYSRIKTVLINNGLIDVNGRRIAAGTRITVSSILLGFVLIIIIISYF